MNKQTVRQAYCPASLSFIFKVCPDTIPLNMGSVGVGCTVNKGVKVHVQKSDVTKILFNQTSLTFPTVSSVVKKITQTPVSVSISSTLPLAYGFGISGASALATAFALDEYLKLSYKPLQLIEIAHVCEIENKTGLGSVATQITGGFLLKEKPGIPTKVRHLPLVGQKIFAAVIGRIETPTVLCDEKRLIRVNAVAKKSLAAISSTQQISLAEILDISFLFAKESGLLTRSVAGIIESVRSTGGHATMAMIGEVVLSDQKPNCDYLIRELTVTEDTIRQL